MTAACMKWRTTLLSPPVDPHPTSPNTPRASSSPTEIRAFIGCHCEVNEGKPAKDEQEDGRSRLPQNRGREEKKGEAKYRSVYDSGMEGGEEERWPPTPPPQASSSQPGCRGTFPRRRGWQRATRSTESVRAPRPPQSTLPPAASSSSQRMACAKSKLITKKTLVAATVRHRTPHTTIPEAWANTWKRGCGKKKKKLWRN